MPAEYNAFEALVREAAEKYGMFGGAETVRCALSGGADSVSLLLALLSLKEEYGYGLSAVHVDHHIRGEESSRDRMFCEELCRKLSVPIEVHNVNAPLYSKEHKLSPEEGARELRYKIFAESPEGCRVATAHTLNDSAETVLFNLARGSGLKGLSGIPPVRDNIIRPLILCTREDVESYLRVKGQSFMTDSTNLSDNYTRNKIRHNIIPLMEELHGGFYGNIRKLTESLAEDNAYLEKAAEEYADSDLREVHPAVRKRVIIKILKENNIEVNSRRLTELEKLIENGGKAELSGDIYAFAGNGKLSVKTVPKKPVVFEEIKVKMGENPFLCDKTVIIEVTKRENCAADGVINNLLTNDFADYDKIQGDVVLRNRRNGDRYARVNRGFTSRLKKLMNENVPAEERDFIPVLCDSEGVIWVQGFGVADRVKTDENTKNIMSIRVL